MTVKDAAAHAESVVAAEAALARVVEALGDAERQLTVAKDGPSRAGAELAALDALEVEVTLGERDEAELAVLRRKATDNLETATATVRRLEAVVTGLRPRVEQAEHAVKVARAEVALERLEGLGPHLQEADVKFGDRLRAAVAEARKRGRILAEIDAATADAAALCAEAGLAEPLPPDEVDWVPDGLEHLVAAVARLGWKGGRAGEPAVVPAKPLTPRADRQRAASEWEQKTAAEAARKRSELLDELTRRSFHLGERLFEGEPVADVVRRLVEFEIAPPDIEAAIDDVMQRRQVVSEQRLAEDKARLERAAVRLPLDETEVRWRIANEIEIDREDVPFGFEMPESMRVDLDDDGNVPAPAYDGAEAA